MVVPVALVKTIKRTARKAHRCFCGGVIRPGETYLEFIAFPSDEACYGNDRPMRGRECPECSKRYGRGSLVDIHPVRFDGSASH